jgi:hypothetical protein
MLGGRNDGFNREKHMTVNKNFKEFRKTIQNSNPPVIAYVCAFAGFENGD